MKKIFFTVSLLFVSLCVVAQTDEDYLWYLNKAKEQLGKGECEKAERNYRHYKELAHDSLPQLHRQIQECIRVQKEAQHYVDTEIVFVPVQVSTSEPKVEPKEEPKKENKFKDFLKDRNNPYCKAGRNRYIAWTIVSAGYPWNVGTGVELRGGGILGLGGYADIGVDFSRFSCTINDYDNNYRPHSWHNDLTKVTFHWDGGIRFYYKGLFLSFGYGTIGRNGAVEIAFSLGESSNDEAIKKKLRVGHGPNFHVGYNMVTSEWGFFLGVSGGLTYDVVYKVVAPSVNLKLGMSFEWKKY